MTEHLGDNENSGVNPGEFFPVHRPTRRAKHLMTILSILNDLNFIKALREGNSNPFDKTFSMIRASEAFEEFIRTNDLIHRNTELHITGTALELSSRDPIAVGVYHNSESQDREDFGEDLLLYIPPEDSLICLFDSFSIEPVEHTLPEEQIYTAKIRVINASIIPGKQGLSKTLIPGHSFIKFPIEPEGLEIEVVAY